MNILVTGGFGFLGSHLVERLLSDRDNRVHVVDNLSTSPLPLEDLLRELGPQPNLSWTITDVESFYRDFGDERFDAIYHLASVVGPAGVLSHSGRIAASIINDTMAMVDLALRSRCRLVDISTSEIYGGGREGFCSESMAKIVPAKNSARLEYAVGKLAAETALANLCETSELDACIVRPFNISGPRQSGRGGFVLPRFVGQALSGLDLTVFGDGQQVRAFTHVRDMVDGILLAMQRGQRGEAYNIGNPANRTTIMTLAEEVRELSESQSEIQLVDPKTIYGPLYEEANDKYPDSQRAMSELGWQPRYDRRRTIREVIDYMRCQPVALREQLQGFATPVVHEPKLQRQAS